MRPSTGVVATVLAISLEPYPYVARGAWCLCLARDASRTLPLRGACALGGRGTREGVVADDG